MIGAVVVEISVTDILVSFSIVVVVFLYFYVIGRMKEDARERFEKKKRPVKGDILSSTELDRYARHIVLREIGGPGQKKLRKAKVLVVGAGGLGSPVLQYLAAAGIGTIGIVDDDKVSISNLQRQVLFDEGNLGKPKVFAAQERLKLLNPFVEVLPYNRKMTEEVAKGLVEDFDLVVDGTDNFETRQIVNAACVQTNTPLVSGAISQWEGQLTVYDPANGTPCMNCVFPKPPSEGQAPTCAQAGVMGALPGIIGSMMAAEVVKWVAGAGTVLTNQMLVYDVLELQVRKIQINKNESCSVCGS